MWRVARIPPNGDRLIDRDLSGLADQLKEEAVCQEILKAYSTRTNENPDGRQAANGV